MPTAALTDRAVIRIAGPDARVYLQDLVTNDIARLTRATPLWTGLLNAQGKLLFDFVAVDGGDGTTVLADVAAARADALAQRLAMYRLRRAVTVARDPALSVFAAWGDGTPADLPADPQLAALGVRWIAPTAATDATLADYAAHRAAHGVPDSGDLIPDRMLWLEANAVELNGVSFTKGCYVGQENTARMHHRDKLRRRVVPVAFDGDPGDGIVTTGGVAVGELTRHADGRGFAYLRIEAAAGPLRVGEATLTVAWPEWLGHEAGA